MELDFYPQSSVVTQDYICLRKETLEAVSALVETLKQEENDKMARLIILDCSLARFPAPLPPSVTSLDLSMNQLSTIELEGLVNLRVLRLSHNLIRKVYGLDDVVQLEELVLDHNLLTSVENVAQLPCLRLLDVSCNMISKVSSVRELSLCSSLRELRIQCNPVASLRAQLVNLLPQVELLDTGLPASSVSSSYSSSSSSSSARPSKRIGAGKAAVTAAATAAATGSYARMKSEGSGSVDSYAAATSVSSYSSSSSSSSAYSDFAAVQRENRQQKQQQQQQYSKTLQTKGSASSSLSSSSASAAAMRGSRRPQQFSAASVASRAPFLFLLRGFAFSFFPICCNHQTQMSKFVLSSSFSSAIPTDNTDIPIAGSGEQQQPTSSSSKHKKVGGYTARALQTGGAVPVAFESKPIRLYSQTLPSSSSSSSRLHVCYVLMSIDAPSSFSFSSSPKAAFF